MILLIHTGMPWIILMISISVIALLDFANCLQLSFTILIGESLICCLDPCPGYLVTW